MCHAFARTVVRASPVMALWPSLLAPCAASLTDIMAVAAHTQARPGSDARPALTLCVGRRVRSGTPACRPGAGRGARLRGGGEAALQLGLVGLRLQVAVAGAHARLQPADLSAQLLQLGLLLLRPARARAGAASARAARWGERGSAAKLPAAAELAAPRNGHRGGRCDGVLRRCAGSACRGGIPCVQAMGMGEQVCVVGCRLAHRVRV